MSKYFFLIILTFFSFQATFSYGDEVIWSGEVHSDGTPSLPISLVLHQTYQIKASGFVNLGKWVQNREKLANDACYEFNSKEGLTKIETLKNSSDISVCDGTYHKEHLYQSKPFKATQNKIHFWLNDTDYEDNSGALRVEILKIDAE